MTLFYASHTETRVAHRICHFNDEKELLGQHLVATGHDSLTKDIPVVYL